MNILALLLLLLLSLCICQQRPYCPRWGRTRRPDPNNSRRFLQCNDGRGRWFVCTEGFVYVDKQQDCVRQSRSPSQYSSRGNSGRQVTPNNNRRSSGANNGGVEFDYHW